MVLEHLWGPFLIKRTFQDGRTASLVLIRLSRAPWEDRWIPHGVFYVYPPGILSRPKPRVRTQSRPESLCGHVLDNERPWLLTEEM